MEIETDFAMNTDDGPPRYLVFAYMPSKIVDDESPRINREKEKTSTSLNPNTACNTRTLDVAVVDRQVLPTKIDQVLRKNGVGTRLFHVRVSIYGYCP